MSEVKENLDDVKKNVDEITKLVTRLISKQKRKDREDIALDVFCSLGMINAAVNDAMFLLD